MSADPNRLETLVSVPGETEAALIANLLQEHGICAKAVGGYTSGFKAEAPGEASVLVGQADLARAKELLAEIRAELREIDWSTVDVGCDAPARDREDRPSETPSGLDRRRLQFTLAGLLALQTSICLVIGLWKGLGAAAFTLLFLPTAALLLLALGTVGIASDLDRARRGWRHVGQLLLVGLIALAVLVLILLILLLQQGFCSSVVLSFIAYYLRKYKGSQGLASSLFRDSVREDRTMTRDDVRAASRRVARWHGRFAGLSGRREVQVHSQVYLRGLLSNQQRKNVEAIALRFSPTEDGTAPGSASIGL